MEKVPENRNSGTIFFRKTEISGTLFRNYGSLQYSGTFRNVYGMETGNFSGLRNGNWKFYGFHSVKRKFFRFTWSKPENFRFPFIPQLSRNSGLRNKFPDHSISKMEIFFRKNGNPTPNLLISFLPAPQLNVTRTIWRGLKT